jgi:NADH-quinone oxidoreductase subunit K
VATLPTQIALLFPAILFVLGLLALLLRRNLIFMLLALEIMLNSSALAFVIAASRWQQPDGQVMFIFILTMSAAEAAVGLALVLRIHHKFKTLDPDALRELRG